LFKNEASIQKHQQQWTIYSLLGILEK